jgi:protein SCO1/2
VPLPGKADWIRTAAASILICAAGGVLLCTGTDGFQAFTTEQARRLSIEQSPRVIPVVPLEDQDGRAFALSDYAGQSVAVNFIYTQCTTVCALLSTGFQRVHNASDDGDVQLLSISFDPRDTPNRLKEYASHFGADGGVWRFGRVRDTTAIGSLLRAFGVVVIPDGKGDFQHNAAIHVVNAAGRLSRILDPDASSEAVVQAVSRR